MNIYLIIRDFVYICLHLKRNNYEIVMLLAKFKFITLNFTTFILFFCSFLEPPPLPSSLSNFHGRNRLLSLRSISQNRKLSKPPLKPYPPCNFANLSEFQRLNSHPNVAVRGQRE